MSNTLKNLTIVTAAFGFAAAASAQNTTQIDKPWKVELGAYFPTPDISGADEKVGATFALGYSFLRLRDTFDLEVELRGTAYTLEFGGGDADVEIGQILLNGYYRTPENPLFFNFGIGAGKGEIKFGGITFQDDDTDFVWNLGVGYQFQPQFYGIAKYHGGSEDGYRGFSIGVGYRF